MDEKIAKLYQNLKQEGIDDVRARDIIQKIEEYYDCLSDFNLEELDYIGALKAIQYGRFLKSNNASGDNAKVWNDAKVYSDDNVVIWKPKNFQEASIIGIPQWCVSAQDYHWNDHANSGDTIYMIYCGWESGNRQFVSACVERNGNIILYESGHDRIEGVEKEQYLKNLGNGLSVLKPSNNRLNCNLNMNKKLIRLTEQDLHRIVKESVNKVLNESISFKKTIQSFKSTCDDLNMNVEFGEQYVYDGIPTLPVKVSSNDVEAYEIDEIMDFMEAYSWVSPPMPKYNRNTYTLTINGELMPS